jgi:hypothetical protein
MDNSFLIRWAIAGGALLLCIILYRVILRIFFGVVIVPQEWGHQRAFGTTDPTAARKESERFR